MQKTTVTDGRASLVCGGVEVHWEDGRLTVNWPERGAAVQCLPPHIAVDGEALEVAAPRWVTELRAADLSDDLGGGQGFEVTLRLPDLVELVLLVRATAEPTTVVMHSSARCLSPEPITVQHWEPLRTEAGLDLGPVEAGELVPTVYADSGGQGGTHIARLEGAVGCRGICAVYNPPADTSLVCAWLCFEHDNTATVKPGEAGLGLVAATTSAIEVAPGEEHSFDPLLLDCRRSPLEALERYADAVKAWVQPPIPDEMPMGWISWYGYRLTMTEENVLANAEVVARHFRKYGLTVIQPDHGWQYRDICGNWVANDKFPHGMRWLAERLGEMGFELGLWAAPSVVSEFAPLVQQHPEALTRDANGELLVTVEHWHWEPHGRCYQVDPMTLAGQEFLRQFARTMNEYGITYLKSDFISSWGGARRLRTGMGVLREELDPGIILRPCSTALNTQLGICNEIGIARDIGNATGNWQHMRVETLELASKWFMHRRFWLNNPDTLIVGDANESPGEAIGRVTLLGLTGGVVFLADRMPELERQPERLTLVSLCLPGSGVAARPLDLFRIGRDGREYPRVWHLHAQAPWGEWEVVGAFNWSEQALAETIDLAELGVPEGEERLVFDFWSRTLVGRFTGQIPVVVPPGAARCLRIMRAPDHPWVLSTDMHVTQGLVELHGVGWDAEAMVLSGEATRAPGETGSVYLYLPPGYGLAEGAGAEMVGPCCARLGLSFEGEACAWSVRCARDEAGQAPALNPPASALQDPVLRWPLP